jgi:hypothetical protein
MMAVPTAYMMAMVMRGSTMVRATRRWRILLPGSHWGLRQSYPRKAQHH